MLSPRKNWLSGLFSGLEAGRRSRRNWIQRAAKSTESVEQRLLLSASDLFISEYLEGSSNNKALEIYNAGTTDVDLSDIRLERYSNGTTTATNIPLSGTLVGQDVFVIANAGANDAIMALADATSSNINHNGDDAYILRQISTDIVLDMFGVVGNDPGTAWTDSGVSTVDRTLRRKSTITVGNPSGFTPITNLSAEWDSFPIDTSAGLGSHTTSTPAAAAINLVLDYSFDANNFFDPNTANGAAARAALEAAASVFEARIFDSLDAITPSGSNTWTAQFLNPATGAV